MCFLKSVDGWHGIWECLRLGRSFIKSSGILPLWWEAVGKTGSSRERESPGIGLQGDHSRLHLWKDGNGSSWFLWALLGKWVFPQNLGLRKASFVLIVAIAVKVVLMLLLHFWAHPKGPSKSKTLQLGCVIYTPRGAIPRSGAWSGHEMVFVSGAVGKDSGEPETNFSPFIIIFSSLFSLQCNLAISICGSLIKNHNKCGLFHLASPVIASPYLPPLSFHLLFWLANSCLVITFNGVRAF